MKRKLARQLGLALLLCLCLTNLSCKTNKGNDMHKLAQMNTPIFWAEGHPGTLDRESWTLEVTGHCTKPQTFTWDQLMKMPKTLADARLTSVTRWSVRGVWGGVSLADLLKAVGMTDSCRCVRFWSHGLVYDTSIPVDIALKERSIVAWEFDGELLTEDYGGPIRAFIPYLWGYKSAKSIVKIELMSHYVPGYWELRGYTDSAEIEAGPCRDINDGGKMKRIPSGEVIEFK